MLPLSAARFIVREEVKLENKYSIGKSERTGIKKHVRKSITGADQTMTNKINNILDDLIKDIIDSFNINENGKAEFPDIGDYNDKVIWLYILEPRIAAKLTEIKFSLGKGAIGLEIPEVFRKLKKENKTTFKEFEIEFDKKIQEWSDGYPVVTYTLVYPLNFKVHTRIDSEINGDKFKIISFEELKSEFSDADRMIKELEKDLIAKHKQKMTDVFHDFSFFIIDVDARNSLFAGEYSTEKLQYILALLIFAQSIHKLDKYTLYGQREKISQLALSYILIREGNNYLAYLTFNRDVPPLEGVKGYDFNYLLKALRYYNKIKSRGIAEVLQKGLIPYYWASVDEDSADSYLKYWISVESLLLKSRDIPGKKGISEREVCNIIKNMPNFWRGNKPLIDKRIESVFYRRNKYVHEFESDIFEQELYYVKAIAEMLIEFLLDNNGEFSSKDQLEIFYKLVQKDDAVIKHKLLKDVQLQNDPQLLQDNQKMSDLIMRLRHS